MSLRFEYDRDGDILAISRCHPYAQQVSEELGDDIVVRLNPASGAVEGIELLFFSARFQATDRFEIPIDAILTLSAI